MFTHSSIVNHYSARTHSMLIQDSLSTHSALTQYSLSAHSVLTQHSLRSHSVLTQYSLSTHSVLTQYSLSTHSVLTQYSLSTLSVLTQCSLSTHSVLTQYSLSTHSVLTQYSPLISPWGSRQIQMRRSLSARAIRPRFTVFSDPSHVDFSRFRVRISRLESGETTGRLSNGSLRGQYPSFTLGNTGSKIPSKSIELVLV